MSKVTLAVWLIVSVCVLVDGLRNFSRQPGLAETLFAKVGEPARRYWVLVYHLVILGLLLYLWLVK